MLEAHPQALAIVATLPTSRAFFILMYCTIALISHAHKVMLKILQARLQQYVNRELQMFKLVVGKAEEPEIKWPTSAGSLKK